MISLLPRRLRTADPREGHWPGRGAGGGNHPPWMAGGYRYAGSVSEQVAD